MRTQLEGGIVMRRAVTLTRKPHGGLTLIDVFEVEGGKIHDYNMRVSVPHKIPAFLGGQKEDQTFFAPVGSQDFYAPPAKPIRRASFSVEPTLRPRKRTIYQEHSYYPLRKFMTAGKVKAGWQAKWKRQDRSVTVRVLSPCDELITYQSPAWRSQVAVSAEPNDYADTVLLRQRGPQSRFEVVYEIAGR